MIFAPLTFYAAHVSQNFGSKVRHQSLAADGNFVLRKYQNNAPLREICNYAKVMHLSGIYAPLGRLASSVEILQICENMRPYKKCLVFRLVAKFRGQNPEKGLFYSKLQIVAMLQPFRLSISIVSGGLLNSLAEKKRIVRL